MKDLINYINENFYKNTVGDDAYRLYSYYFCHDGFQWGWSSGLNDKDWLPIFDMNFLKNYYNKYYNPDPINKNISDLNWNYYTISKKIPRGAKGPLYYDLCRASLIFAILSAKCTEPDEKAITEALSKFLNKENGADKDTIIKVKKVKSYFGKADYCYNVYIINTRIAPQLKEDYRPLYITLIDKKWAQE